MLNRIMQLSEETDSSIFLFGGRQTGKTTILHQQFPNAIFFDLLDTSIKMRLLRRPSLLYETLRDKPAGTLVIIDEIPEVPELLNVQASFPIARFSSRDFPGRICIKPILKFI